MKPLTKAIDDYLALRRSLGFKLHSAGVALMNFASFMERQQAQSITTRLTLDWAQQPRDAQPAHWAQRLSFVRGFARHHVATDPSTEVPPPGLLPYRPARARPYLYSHEEVRRLLEQALQLPGASSLRPWTYHALLGLLRRAFAWARRCGSGSMMSTSTPVCLPCAVPSSASRDWYRSTPRLERSWPAIRRTGAVFCVAAMPTISSSLERATGSTAPMYDAPSTACRGRPGCAAMTTAMALGCTSSIRRRDVDGLVPIG